MHFIGDSFLSLSFPIWWYLERSCLAKSLYLNTSTRLYFVSSRGNRSRYRGAGHRKQRGTKGPITRTVMLLPRKQPTDCVCSPLQRFRGSRIRPFDVGESIRHVAIRYVHKKKKKKKNGTNPTEEITFDTKGLAYFFSLNLYLSNRGLNAKRTTGGSTIHAVGRTEVTIITPVNRGKLNGGTAINLCLLR